MPNRWMWWWIGAVLVLLGQAAQAQPPFWPTLPSNEPKAKESAEVSASLPADAASLAAAPSNKGPTADRRGEEFQQPDRRAPSGKDRHLAQAPGEVAPASSANGSPDTAKGFPDTVNGAMDTARGFADAILPHGGASLSASNPGQAGGESASASGRQPVRLGPVQKDRPLSGVSGNRFDPTASTLTVLSSLAVVLGVFLLLVWAIRRAMPRSSQLLPSDVVEVLGRAPLLGKQQMHLVRFGPKLLLISVSPEGVDTLTEIEHPDEVARIVALCRQNQPGSIPGAFRQILDQMSRQKSAAGLRHRSGDFPAVSTEPVEPEHLPDQEPAHV